jgi:phosphatidylglycerol:prolipoprotein diacylglycerol transferase
MNSLLAFVMHWNIKPEIFMITENFGIRWYSLLYGAAFFLGYNILFWEFKKENKNTDGADQLLMYMFFAVLIGARLGHVFFYQWDYYSQHLLEIVQIWKGGLASHGAAIAITIALIRAMILHMKNRGRILGFAGLSVIAINTIGK